MSISKSKKRVFIPGSKGMVGSALVRLLIGNSNYEILTSSREELNLLNENEVRYFFKNSKIDNVILAAAKVGGIHANISYPAQFLFENLQIQNNVIHNAFENKVKKLVFLGSSCIYPKFCPQPMKEEYLLSGELEPTNEGYAIAKIAGLKLCEYYRKQYSFNAISIMPCNLYGPNDSFDLNNSHVLSALVKRFSDAVESNASEIILWGSGIARREFMHVDDIAKAIWYLMENYHEEEFINVGWGEDISIRELALIISKKTGFQGRILWDKTKPDGMMKKCLDVRKMREIGFAPNITLENGIDQMIDIYKQMKNII
jgi:GDP-L-fucose synthase